MKSFQEFIAEAAATKPGGGNFQVGDVVHVKWHSTTDPVSHGTTNIDKASDAYAYARHPNIPSLTIKVHQGSGRQPGASSVRGHYAFHRDE